MRRLPLLLLLITLFFTTQPASARDPKVSFAPGAHLRFEHISIEDGLSQNAGLVFLQDNKGFLWIGTQDGLNRYDGYKITQFKHDPDDEDTISQNGIISLYQDEKNNLWVGTWGGGLNRYDPASSKFTRYLADPENQNSLSDPVVTEITPDGKGGLWIGTLGGLNYLDLKTGKVNRYTSDPNNPDTLSSNAISAILPAEDGKLWVGTGAYSAVGAGLNLFDPATGKALRYGPADECLKYPNISDLQQDTFGNLWISYGGYGVSGGGIDRYNPTTQLCNHYDIGKIFDNQITDNNITDLLFDQSGALWATSWSGGVWYMPSDQIGRFIGIQNDPGDPESLSNNNDFAVYQDRSGVIWIGTLSAGINKLNLDTLQFRTYRRNSSQMLSLPSNHIGAFAQTMGGSIWVGTWENGLVRFFPERGTFTSYQTDPNDPTTISSNLVMSLYPDPDGTLWVGTLGGGLNHFTPNTGEFVRYKHDAANPNSLLEDQVTSILVDNDGRLWVGNFLGLSRLDPGSANFVNYPFNSSPVALKMIGSELWIGTWGEGVYSLDLSQPANLVPTTATYSRLNHDRNNKKSINDDNVWSILQSPDGIIWLGTQGGLNRYDPKTKDVKSYTENNGLRNNTILGILQDDAGYLWLTTNNGLARFDPETEKVRVYDRNDGLQGNEFNSNAYYQSGNGDFYVGGVSGFSVFNPKNLSDNPAKPSVEITDFSVFNTSRPFDTSGKTPITLNYDQNFISFEFASLDYRSPGNNQYAYKLEGFDQDWVLSGSRNYASYTNLPGGRYTFQVKTMMGNGEWIENGAEIPLIVTPPFWQTWIFRFGSLILLIGMVVGGFQWRTYAVRAQNVKLQKIISEQRRAESELRASEARFRVMFDNAAVGVAMMSLNRVIEQVNPKAEQITGYTQAELALINPSDLIFIDDRYNDVELFKELVVGKREQYLTEKRYIRKNGDLFWGRINFALVKDDANQPLYIVGIIEDITEEKLVLDRLAAQETEHLHQLEQKINERTDELNKANELLRENATHEAVIAERTRLARDLHDAVTQTLFSTTLIADVLPEIWDMNPSEGRRRLEEVRQLTRGALAEMRTLLVELRPNALVEVPLATLLRQLTEAMIGRSRIDIQLSAEGERKLPADVQVGLYRLAQEALNNVVKHARANQAVVTLRLGDSVRLTIADNGTGFDPSTVTADHLGLKIMRERAEAIGARFNIYSEPGEGTQISIIWGAAS